MRIRKDSCLQLYSAVHFSPLKSKCLLKLVLDALAGFSGRSHTHAALHLLTLPSWIFSDELICVCNPPPLLSDGDVLLYSLRGGVVHVDR